MGKSEKEAKENKRGKERERQEAKDDNSLLFVLSTFHCCLEPTNALLSSPWWNNCGES